MMKKVVVICAVGLALVMLGVAVAQQSSSSAEKTPANKGEIQLSEKLAKVLKLTEAQKAELKSILTDRRNKLRALKEDQSLSLEQKKAKAKEIIQASNERIKALLTPEQQKKFERLRDNLRRNAFALREKRIGSWKKELRKPAIREKLKSRASRLAPRLADALKLTESQKQQIKPIIQERREKVKSILEDQKLTAEQKRMEIRKLRDQTRERISRILTPEQREKLEKMKSKLVQRIRERETKKPA